MDLLEIWDKRYISLMLSILLSLFISQPSLAATSCPTLNTTVVEEVIFLKEESCELATDISELFASMSKVFGVAPKITLVMGGAMDNASFDLGKIIQVPYRMEYSSQYGQRYSVPIINLLITAAHEYGHAIFHEAVKKHHGKTFAATISELNKLSARKKRLLKGTPDKNYQADNITLMKSDGYQSITKQLTPYSEFFADTLAVFYYQDKGVMFEALYYPEMSMHSLRNVEMRDFGNKLNPHWNYMMDEEHAKLALTRIYVGESVWPANHTEARTLANKILKAILRVTSVNIKSNADLTPEAANEQLITELKK